jgi:outer membrane immunogenic protein
MTISSRALAAGLFGLLSISAASAADLYVDVPVAAPVIVDDVAQWDGPYVGIFGGYQSGPFTVDGEGGGDFTASGWLAGLTVGFDKAVGGGLVLGVVGDIARSDISSPDYNFAGFDWVGSLRGRLGFDGGAFLPYLTGGVAVAHLYDLDVETTLVGWTVGGGVEIAATDELSVDLQYRYSDYGTKTLDFGGGIADESFRSHQITAGLNWRF